MNDNFKTVNFNAGQEVRAQDLSDAQKFLSAMISDQILSKLTAGDVETRASFDASALPSGGGSTQWCHALTVSGGQPRVGTANNKVRMSPGTVFARVASESGNDRTFLPWTFTGTEEVTISNGHATQWRWDLIQLKLELDNTDLQARVFSNPPASSVIDLSTVAASVTIEVSASIQGSDGNSIRVRFQPGTGGVSIVESGRDVTITYTPSTSTVQNVVDAITTNATLIVVSDYSSPTTVLTDPSATFDYQSLSGGTNTVLLSNTLNMKRRVVGTLSVKESATFTVSNSTYPVDPDPGFVPIAMILVPPTWAGATPISYYMEEQYSASQVLAVMHDLRLPMNVREYVVEADDMKGPDNAVWDETNTGGDYLTKASNQSISGGHALVARCPVRIGRLIGVTCIAGGGVATATRPDTGGVGDLVGTIRGGAIVVPFFTPGYTIDTAGADLSSLWTTTEATATLKFSNREEIEKNPFNAGVVNTFSTQFGYPIWCNGGRVCVENGVEPTQYRFRHLEGVGTLIGAGPYQHGLAVLILNATEAKITRVIFHIAEGL